MCPHISKHPVAVFAIKPPFGKVIMDIIRAKNFIVSPGGCGPLPRIPVYTRGDDFGGEIAGDRGSAYANPHFFQFSNGSTSHHLNRTAKFPTVFCALLAAGLKNDLVFLDRVGHRPPFLDGQRNWLFTVNMFFCPGRTNGGFTMPVVRGGNQDGIQRFILE